MRRGSDYLGDHARAVHVGVIDSAVVRIHEHVGLCVAGR